MDDAQTDAPSSKPWRKMPHIMAWAQTLFLRQVGQTQISISDLEVLIDTTWQAALASPRAPSDDTARIDWLESVLRGSSEGWAEVYFSGLRHGAAPAIGFQMESNPEVFPTFARPTLRELLDEVRLAPMIDDDPVEEHRTDRCSHGVGFDEDCEACESDEAEERIAEWRAEE